MRKFSMPTTIKKHMSVCVTPSLCKTLWCFSIGFIPWHSNNERAYAFKSAESTLGGNDATQYKQSVVKPAAVQDYSSDLIA